MKIVIVGAGKVGYALADQLCRENHDVTIIDSSEEALRHACDTLDVMGFKGNGVSIPTLTEAGAADADLLVSATNMDELTTVLDAPTLAAAGVDRISSSAASTRWLMTLWSAAAPRTPSAT